MPIIIKHGAEIEGKGIAYGAAARTAYIREQEKRQREREHKAKRLGDIGSILSTAGAVSAFIPGMQPIAAGLSIAGGVVSGAAGGRGDVTGKAVAASAQGIASVYHAYGEKIKAKQDEWDGWKKRQDYVHELSSLKKQESLDREIEARDTEFIQLTRGQNRKYVDQKNNLLEAVNLGVFKSHDLDTLEKVSMIEGPYGNALKPIIPKLKELRQEHRAVLKQIDKARLDDPTMTVERLIKQQREEAKIERNRLEEQQKILEEQAEQEQQATYKRASTIKTQANIISSVEQKLAKEPSDEETAALIRQRNFATGELSKAIVEEYDAVELQLNNGNPKIMRNCVDSWVFKRVEELVAQHRAGIGSDLSEELWSRHLGKLTNDYKRIANAELDKLEADSPTLFYRELAEDYVNDQFGLIEGIE